MDKNDNTQPINPLTPPYTRITKVGLDKVLPVRERLPGVHVSDIINFIAIQQGVYKENSEEDKFARYPLFQLGLLFEETMTRLEQEEDPGLISQWWDVVDGIILTPDTLMIDKKIVRDYKFTKKSSTKVLEDPTGRGMIPWWTQIAAYLNALDWRVGSLKICFINGDYVWPSEVEIVEMERGFTRLELDKNWKKLVANREATVNYMRERGKI